LEEIITKILSSDSCIEILTPFCLNSYFYDGKIRIGYKGAKLDFDVSIPKCYPFTLPNTDNISITFKNESLIGYSHINTDGSVCIHPNKDDDFERKLKSEIDGLKTWIYDYYICKKEDDNYTYLIHNSEKGKSSTLYFSDNDKKFRKDDFGVFQYSNFTNNEIQPDNIASEKFKIQTFYRIGFDKDFEDKWSLGFLNKLKLNPYKGFWVYIESEPIIDELGKRKSIETWNQLERYLPKSFFKHLYDSFKGLNKNFFFEEDLFFLLGYKIPNDEGYEVHWDLVKIRKNKLPITSVLIPKENRASKHEKYEGVCTTDKITWGSTVNSNYERFFGRGGFSKNIVNSKILIIGCGALGSCLAEILVRGGCKYVALDDFDTVASGNLCRSKYDLLNLNTRKIDSLKSNLTNISPYVNICNIPFKLNYYSGINEWLNKSIDFVFDCSTDTEVTYSLDKSGFIGKIFSLGITNKAKELICICGNDITRKTNHLYEFLGNEEPSYFEGAGCGYPTFEANFNDISSLLNLAMMNINFQIDNSSFSDNFIINQNFDNGFKNLKIRGYQEFFEKSASKFLYISSETLSKIKRELLHHYPNEFGGVFVGYKQDDLIVIDDVLIPDDFENGKTIFIRRPGTLNDRLELIFNKTDGKITYIGEWHSHPDGPPIPSYTDLTAMKEIADTKKIRNSNPILMIVKISEEIFEPVIYIYNKNKLLRYEQS
jgi:integrative and conjugative element protein (TIGR02256 family)